MLVAGASISPTIASTAGYVISAALNYFMNYTYTFQSAARHSCAMASFTLVALAGLALNGGIMKVGTDWMGVNYLIVQIIAIGCVVMWNFFANRRWTFGRRWHS